MRSPALFRLMLLAFGLGASACDDTDAPLAPPADVPESPEAESSSAQAAGRWADGYLTNSNPTNLTELPAGFRYNRSGGKITLVRPAGTTGRYVATFAGLSALLGTKSTVQVTAAGSGNSHCKPVNGTLANDKVEVRCFNSATGAPVESQFSLVVLRKAPHRAFAFAHKPTATSYTPQGKGSWNPSGSMRVTRFGTGSYKVTFDKLGTQLAGNGGNVQVSAVGTGNAYCKIVEEWGGSPNLGIVVQCYGLVGQPVDARFTVLFQRAAPHLAFAYVNRAGTYAPEPFWSSNPTGGPISIQRASMGIYYVDWRGVDPEIFDLGTAQVTALGFYDYGQCRLQSHGSTIAAVQCFAPNGTLVDLPFTVLMGS